MRRQSASMCRRVPTFTLLLTLLVALLPLPAAAQDRAPDSGWSEQGSASRLVLRAMADAEHAALASYGPFRVLDGQTAALVDVTDSASPAQFQAMLKAYPGIRTLRFHDCPGTYDDQANLRLGRLIRIARLAVEVPEGGSVRSGAVELVFAGRTIAIADRAEFAVHGWEGEDGRGAQDYPPESPQHRIYLAYYRDMGLDPQQAAQFYAMTNSVTFDHALWLTGQQLRDWVPDTERAPMGQADNTPKLAYLDLEPLLN